MPLLTTTAHVLLYIAEHPETTWREVAVNVGITERTALAIARDLEAGGYMQSKIDGRKTVKTVAKRANVIKSIGAVAVLERHEKEDHELEQHDGPPEGIDHDGNTKP